MTKSYSQVINIEKRYSENIIINSDSGNKTSIFIFVMKDNTNRKTIRLLNNLETFELDYSIFNIYLITIIPEHFCPPEKIMMLDNYSNLPSSFVYDPYYIIIKNDQYYFDSLTKAKLDINSLKSLSKVRDKNMNFSPFINVRDDYALINLIKKNDNTLNIIDSLRIKLNKESSENAYFRNKVDSTNISNQYSGKYLSVTYLPPLFADINMPRNKPMSLSYGNTKLRSIQFLYCNYPFKKLKNIGYGLGLGYSQFRSLVSISNHDNSFIDTVQRLAYDPNGDPYTRIAYGKDIKEKISIAYVSIIASLSYKFPIQKKKDIGYVSINPGIKLSNILSSTYIATDGYMTYGGFYKQYNKDDTVFSGLYDFDQKKPVHKESKRLELNNSFVSTFISLDLAVSPFKQKRWSKLYFNCSLFGERGSNMLYNHPKENKLSDNSGDYNSLLYRSNQLNIRTLGLRLGLSYGF